MSVYIKGMEMPKNCCGCVFSCYTPTGKTPFCKRTGKDLTADVYFNKRSSDCPLVPVPPHGRLGDLDALVDWLKLSYGTSIPIVRGLLFSSIIKEIQEYPSVIPAEQKRKEEGDAK